MSIGLIGIKTGMTRVFDESGASIPVTVINVDSNRISQIKTTERDGYNAIQVDTCIRDTSHQVMEEEEEEDHFVTSSTTDIAEIHAIKSSTRKTYSLPPQHIHQRYMPLSHGGGKSLRHYLHNTYIRDT